MDVGDHVQAHHVTVNPRTVAKWLLHIKAKLKYLA